MFLRWPCGNALVIMLTDVGKQRETATPWNALNRISSIPVLARPEAKMKTPSKKHPMALTFRGPTASAIEAERRRVQPLANLHLHQSLKNISVGMRGLTSLQKQACTEQC
jgi:hypothetical protein